MTPTAHQQPYAARFRELYTDPTRRCRGLYWHGAAGVGKTAVATHLARSLAGSDCIIGSAADLVAETQAAIGGDKEARSLWRMLSAVKGAKLVVLDDLGRERNAYARDVMFALLDAALQGRAFVVVTANCDAATLAESYGGDEGLYTRLQSLESREWPATMPNCREPACALPLDRPRPRCDYDPRKPADPAVIAMIRAKLNI